MASTARLQLLNDLYRRHGLGFGCTMVTMGVIAQGDSFVAEALKLVREANTFNPENDPHDEHNFGSFDVQGQKVFFRLDYYDRASECASPDPGNPMLTCRVLTIGLMSEC